MNAGDILKLLEGRHAKDVFIPECKNGPSFDGLLKIDAWAMSKSWAHPATIGYEIKISRSDFLRDQKWTKYLDYCNSFYFVTPPGIIQVNELPPEAGLLEVTKTGTSFYTRKKTLYRREVRIPEDFYRYILMCRVKIVPSTMNNLENPSNLEYWRNWLQEKKESQSIGHAASRRLQVLLKERIHKVQDENERLLEVKQFLEEIGLEPTKAAYWEVRKKLRLPSDLTFAINRAKQDLERLEKIIQEVQVE